MFMAICTAINVICAIYLYKSTIHHQRVEREHTHYHWLSNDVVRRIAAEEAKEVVGAITRAHIQRTVQEMMVLERKFANKAKE